MGAQTVKPNYPRSEYHDWLASLPKDYCAFCDRDEHEVLYESLGWLWIVNRRGAYLPYSTILIPKRHVERLIEFHSLEMIDLQMLTEMIIGEYKQKLKTDKIMFEWKWRSEKERKGTSTDHLHINVIPYKGELFDHILDPEAHLSPTAEVLKI